MFYRDDQTISSVINSDGAGYQVNKQIFSILEVQKFQGSPTIREDATADCEDLYGPIKKHIDTHAYILPDSASYHPNLELSLSWCRRPSKTVSQRSRVHTMATDVRPRMLYLLNTTLTAECGIGTSQAVRLCCSVRIGN